MKIHQLEKSKWLKDKARRKGRGNATWTGNYSGKGLKGQKARSGHSMKPFFEGWQTSIVQRLPKARGFTRYYKLVKDVSIINLGVLDADERISDAMEITKQLLKDLGYIKSTKAFVKILSNGDYAKHLTFVDVDAFSASAKQKMENPGTVHSVAHKAPAKVKKLGKKPAKKSGQKISKKDGLVKKVVVAKKEKIVKKVVTKKETISTEKPVAKKAPAKKTTKTTK